MRNKIFVSFAVSKALEVLTPLWNGSLKWTGKKWQTNWQTGFEPVKNAKKSGPFRVRVKEVLFL